MPDEAEETKENHEAVPSRLPRPFGIQAPPPARPLAERALTSLLGGFHLSHDWWPWSQSLGVIFDLILVWRAGGGVGGAP